MFGAVIGLGSVVALWCSALLSPPPLSGGALALSWEAPEACPASPEVRRQVTEHLGQARLDRPFAASMVAREQDGGYRVSIAIDDAGVHSERILTGATCAEVASAAALIVAMTIDPRIQPQLPPPPDEVDGALPPAVVAAPARPEEPASARVEEPGSLRVEDRANAAEPDEGKDAVDRTDRERVIVENYPARRLRFAGDVGVGVGAGPLPRAPSAVLFVAGGLRGRAWRVQGTARWWSPRAGPSPNNEAVTVRAQLWDVGAAGCGIIKLGQNAELPLCGTLSAGLMHAQGRGQLRSALRQASVWAAFGIGAEFTWWLGSRVGVGARAHGLVTLARPVFETDPSGLAHGAGPLAGVFGAHFGVRLP